MVAIRATTYSKHHNCWSDVGSIPTHCWTVCGSDTDNGKRYDEGRVIYTGINESERRQCELTKDRSMSNPVDRGTLRQGRVTACGSMVKVSLHEHGRRCEYGTLKDTDNHTV